MEEIDSNDIETNYDRVCETFDEMKLKQSLLHGINAYGLKKPSVIQQRAILPIIEGHDVIAQAQSGTGKTATLSIAVLQKIDPTLNETQALILSPARVLALQIHEEILALGHLMQVKCYGCVGGTRVKEDMSMLKKGQHVVVGTPGRVYDMVQRGVLRTDHIQMFVLDEADEMLSRGFTDQVYEVFQKMPPTVQTVLLLVIMTPEVLQATTKFTKKPVRILVEKEEITLKGIQQFSINVDKEEEKMSKLLDMSKTLFFAQAVIFCNTHQNVQFVKNSLESKEFVVSCIDEKMDQQMRDKILREFRIGSIRILITTDLLARRIDIQEVHLVINFDLPSNGEKYMRRIGRGGGGCDRKSVVINFLTIEENDAMQELEAHSNTKVDPCPGNIADLF